MQISELARELNATLEKEAPAVLDLLSETGRRMYFPRGIISQSAEAKAKAHRYNATIGIATERGVPMHLPSVHKYFNLDPRDLYGYAPTGGKPELREAWRKKQLDENPSMRGKKLSAPIVTAALTHGLSLLSELFVDPGDKIVLPDKIWGNYRLAFGVRQLGKIEQFELFADGGFHRAAFRNKLLALAKTEKKAIVILNFPNNPTGYTPSVSEAESIVETILDAAEAGLRQLVISDDAYFGLFYDESCLQESIFGRLSNLHPSVLAVKLDGATKEQFAWGFRVGFLTYGVGGTGNHDAVYAALEKKTIGAIRAGISNSPHPSQSAVLRALSSPTLRAEQAEKRGILRARVARLHEILRKPEYKEAWTPYPFNSGYFMCIRLNGVDAEAFRLHLLDKYQVGVIATEPTDIRVAFSSVELEDLEDLFDTLYQAWRDLAGKA